MDRKSAYRILVTDANYKNALAIVRSLGKAGHTIIAYSEHKTALSFFSRHCAKRVVEPKGLSEAERSRFLDEIVEREAIDLIMPVGYKMFQFAVDRKEQRNATSFIPLPDKNSMSIACDKFMTLEFAQQIGIPAPRMFRSAEEVDQFPIVLKGRIDSGRVRYVNSRNDLTTYWNSANVAQEYIEGEGYGYYALFRHGEPRAIFMSRRIREYPVTGGAGTAAESVYDERLREIGDKVLRELKWNGVAMVEFKKDKRDGAFKLIEINPKFWGSLDLAIEAGVDFPRLAVEMARDGDIAPVTTYKIGLRYNWPFPDEILHVLAKPGALVAVLRDTFDVNVMSNVSASDLAPNLAQLIATPYIALRSLISGKLYRPHGTPRIRS